VQQVLRYIEAHIAMDDKQKGEPAQARPTVVAV
jgi:hypothetical protein